jgi:hypothetical protein
MFTGSSRPESGRIIQQCSGSLTFWYGFGSFDPYTQLPDPDPALFGGGFQEANKKWVIFCLLLTVGTLNRSLKITCHWEVTKE